MSRRKSFTPPCSIIDSVSPSMPVSRHSLLPSPWRDRLGHSTFRFLISRGCKVHALALSPQLRPPRQRPYGLRRAFDAPLRHEDLSPVPGACYAALRRLPRRDSHPQVRCSTSAEQSRLAFVQDAPRAHSLIRRAVGQRARSRTGVPRCPVGGRPVWGQGHAKRVAGGRDRAIRAP